MIDPALTSNDVTPETVAAMEKWSKLFEDEGPIVVDRPPMYQPNEIDQPDLYIANPPVVHQEPTIVKFVVKNVPKSPKLVLYDVVIPNSNIRVLANIFDRGAAEYVANKLNSGSTMADKNIIGITLLSMEMEKIITDIEAKTKYRALVLSQRNYDQAKQCDDELATLQENAVVVKTKLNKYIV